MITEIKIQITPIRFCRVVNLCNQYKALFKERVLGVSYRRRKKIQKKRTRILKFLALGFTLAFLGLSFLTGGLFLSFARDLPKLEKQAAKKSPETSKLYAADGTFITDFYAEQNRVVVPLSKIPLSLQQAVIAIEDKRFWKHQGVDFEAIVRAFLANLERGEIVEGGSTLTQQYVKNTFISPKKTLTRKIKEAFLAYQVEKKYSKRKILEKYLNTVYFGINCYGAEVAAETFFGKEAKDLTLAETALLAGLIKSPNRYSPYTNPQKALERRNLVLDKMVEEGFISETEAQGAKAAPLQVQPPKERKVPAPYFVDYIKRLFLENPKYGSTPSARANLLFKGGLRIYTTVDLKMQANAEEAVKVLNRPDDPSAALVAIEPKTGYVKVMVGGKDFQSSQFNLAIQGRRQPGSSFKVFVLVTALADGFDSNKTYESSPTTIKYPGGTWKVSNATEGKGGGKLTIREATVSSVNAAYARIIMDVGPAKVAEMAMKMGIKTEIPAFPSIALGSVGVSPLEMASAFSTLPNGGLHNEPLAILKVTNSQGKILEKNEPAPKKILEPAVAFEAIDILREVIQRGTGRRAGIGRPAAGKTGTANSYHDAWFVGFTPDLSAAVWVGYPKAQIAMFSVHGIRVQGGTFPAQIWARFMSQALKEYPPSNFERPLKTKGGYIKVKICSDMDYLATSFCPANETVTKSFKSGLEPTRYCPLHSGTAVPDVVGMESSQAITTLKRAGFNVGQDYEASKTVASGVVMAQSPRSKAPKNSTITITISSGTGSPQRIVVPTVIGMSEAQARGSLSSSGFSASVRYQSIPSSAGKVITQDPPSGVQRNRGSTVTIVVATP